MINNIQFILASSIIFKGKINLNLQKLTPFDSYPALHYAKRVDNKQTFLYGLKQSLKFQLHLSHTLIDAGYRQFNPFMTSAYFTQGRNQGLVIYLHIVITYFTV